MRCPFCGSVHDKVIDSRSSDEGTVVRRRRECIKCSRRFTTYERVDELCKLQVIKKDGTRVPYDHQKMLNGLMKSCYKRPIPAEKLNEVADEVEDELYRDFEKEVDSYEIGRRLAERLKNVDQVAYVRFASVYKQFRDLDDLLEEVKDAFQSGQTYDPNQGSLFKL